MLFKIGTWVYFLPYMNKTESTVNKNDICQEKKMKNLDTLDIRYYGNKISELANVIMISYILL